MNKILFIFGTRPEAIKMAPLILEFKKHSDFFNIEICLTGQHRQMLDQVNGFFGIISDYDLNLMTQNQSLAEFTARSIEKLDPIVKSSKPNLIFVQGDTTTVLAGALVAYYNKIPIAHLEAGLRSGNKYSPFPEEINRKIAAQLSEWHFAPTLGTAENLKKEGINKNIFVLYSFCSTREAMVVAAIK